ncbi:universal stress protein [Pseudomonas plecoglossicida]|jgi:universal stress protein E|uniref:Universal stress protein n=4 Tax=Pseudomonas TaxID=286 RepID=A0ABX4TYA2_PSEDL|nr:MULTISPECIES: universal stress protein [Pseudomonas]GJB78599.1 universal stress protein [Aeromonas caviae]AGA73291.1 UspA domain-containing protein [Pseudomonas putida HB3267]KPM63269.1 universal stress protein [Pseudomonas putida]MCE0754344.1 universal stress protein [Pseudomonas asiatica]MCE0943966.1 universal stress protein [Pseudomonas asiatica]
MDNPQRLLLIASPLMRRTPVYDRAAALAKAKGMALHIVAFDYLEGLATAGLVNDQTLAVMREGYVQQHREWLETQALSMRRNGVTVTTEVVWVQHPLDEILVHLREQPFAMLIKAFEHEPWWARAMFTSLDIQLLRETRIPLHLVHQASHALPRKILAAVDLSRPEDQFEGFNDQIISEALKLALQCNAQIELLYAYDLGSMYLDSGGSREHSFLFDSNLAQTLHEAQSEAFQALAERNGIAAEHRHLRLGDPAKVLALFMENNDIDVLVMGSYHHRGIGWFIGSTAERVLHRLSSSVLVISPEHSQG